MSGYTLVGFTSYMYPGGSEMGRVPFYLPNEEIKGSLYSRLRLPVAELIIIILPELYKVKWAHGKLDLMDILCNGGYINLCDENEKSLIPGALNRGATPAEFRAWVNEVIDLKTNRTRQDVLNEIGQKYPGLFISEFIVPKEEPKIQVKVPQRNSILDKFMRESNFDPSVFRNKAISAKEVIPKSPEIMQSKTKKLSKQSNPVRNPSETKKNRYHRATKYPDWWLNAPNST
jgi:hypothetical protein